jgi:putative ABC transport system substrate-binding protein
VRRREFITLIGSASVAWPVAARAQQAASPRHIGVLLVGLSPDSKEVRQFRLGLRDAGYSEGRDDRLPELVADLVRSKIDVMVMDSTIGTEVAKRATSTIPIVMALVIDPVGSGLVDSLAHPGGNVTGLSMMVMELYPRRLQLLKELIPQLTRAGVLWNPDHPAHSKAVKELTAVAPSLSIELSFVAVQRPEQFDRAFSDVTRANAQALYVIDDPILFAHRTILLKLALAARLPIISDLRRFPEAGGLVSYGPDSYDLFRRSATYVDRILKGSKPADLPVEQPTKFELVINLGTAKALGLTIPDKLLALADDVIE